MKPEMHAAIEEVRRLGDAAVVSRIALHYGVSGPGLYHHVQRMGLPHNANRSHFPETEILRKQLAKAAAKAYGGFCANPVVDLTYPCRVLLLDDLHVPFADMEHIGRMMEEEEADVICTHELLNFDGFSRWLLDYQADSREEEDLGLGIIKLLRRQYPRVIIGDSNHMRRVDKFLSGLMSPDQQQYVFSRLKSALDAYSEQAEGIERIKAQGLFMGDAVFAHFDDYLTVPGRTAERAANWAFQRGQELGREVRHAYVGHTHRLASAPWGGHRGYVHEIGCACLQQPYHAKASKLGTVSLYPWALGYAALEFDKQGRLDTRASRVVNGGWARLP